MPLTPSPAISYIVVCFLAYNSLFTSFCFKKGPLFYIAVCNKVQIFSLFFHVKRSTNWNFSPMINNSPHGACKTVQICIWLCAKRSKIYSVSCEKVHNLELLIYSSLVIYAKRSTFLYSCVQND